MVRHRKSPRRGQRVRCIFNIVHVYEIDRQDNLHYIVMSFIQGESLAQRLHREETIPLNEAIEITVCLCEALAHAHGQDVIHRDIKPSNVLLSREGTPILVDFGVARVNTDDGELTRMGTVLGTVDFMPPEQRKDATLVDARSDLWSPSVTLYQMVTGEPPPVIDLDTVPQQLRQILAKALKSKKEDRYQTATEFADALQKATGVPLPREPSVSVASLQKGQCFQCGTINENSRKFCDPHQLANFRNFLPLAKLYIRTTQLGDDLIHTMTFLTHLKESFPGLRPDRILSLKLDQF